MAEKILTVEDILSAPDLPEKEVYIPEWGGSVRIRGFSKATQQELRRQATGPGGELDTEKMEMLLFLHGVVEPHFTEEHYGALREKSAVAIDSVLQAIIDLAGLSRGAVDNAKRSFRD